MRKTSAKAAWISAAMGRPGGDATPWVFSGTLVVKGHGLALVKQTGTGTELGRIGTALARSSPSAPRCNGRSTGWCGASRGSAWPPPRPS